MKCNKPSAQTKVTTLLHALKAARDAVNTRPDTPGHFIFLGTGSHKSLITDMATRRSQPLTEAVSAAYELLGKDFVQGQLDPVATAHDNILPGRCIRAHQIARL
jgi:hypothetical protein